MFRPPLAHAEHLLTVIHVAHDAVIGVADDGTTKGPVRWWRMGALGRFGEGVFGLVTGQSAPVSEIAMRAAFSSTIVLSRANAAVRALTARLLIGRG